MCNLLKNIFLLILIILKLCTTAFGQNFTLKSLGVICSIYDYTKVTKPPKQCTAMAAFTGLQGQVDGANKMREKLPLLIILDTLNYFQDRELLKKDPAEVLKEFKDVNFDCMAIDYVYKFTTLDGTTSEDVGRFLDKAKKEFPGKGFGLVLDRFLKITEFSSNLKVLVDHADFLLLGTLNYRLCVHHNHQADMEVLATKDDVLGSLNQLREKNQPLDKVIFHIALKIESQTPLTYEDMDYSYLCDHKLSVKRKYCFNTIQNLFEKARLRISEGMAGIHVLGIDYDDYGGKCGCTTSTDPEACFRGLKTIAGASSEDKNDVNFYQCSQGEYPVIK